MSAMIWHEIVCWFLKIYQDLKRFVAQEHRIVFVLTFRCAKQFYVPNMQEQSKAGKKSEINRQTFVIWWLNSRRYRSVWYLFSCTLTLSGTGQGIFCLNKNKGLCWIRFFQLNFFQKFPNSFGGENWDKSGYFDTLPSSLSLIKDAPWLL